MRWPRHLRLLLAAAVVAGVALALPAPAWVDTTGPTVSIDSKPSNPSKSSSASFSFSGAVTYECQLDGGGFAACTSPASYTVADGSHTFTVHGFDAVPTVGPDQSYTWTVDTSVPVVSVPADVSVEATTPTGAPVSYGSVTVADANDPSLTATCDHASGSTFPIAVTTVTCSATDPAGNTGTASFHVTVTDTSKPVVTVPANMTVEATTPSGAAPTFSASATDPNDGSLTPSCSPASGSSFAIGTTTVTCTASDGHGNSDSKSFTVTVRDTSAPVVSTPGDMVVDATGASGAVVTFSASASDPNDGSVAVSCSPTSGSTFPLGATTVTCTAPDGHGNTGSASFTVRVGDTGAPVLSGVPADLTREANGPGGAVVSYAKPTAVDTVDGPIADVSCLPASGSTFPLGSTKVTCSAHDHAGNTTSASFHVTVADTTAPVINVPATVSFSTGAVAASDPTMAAFLNGVGATDLVDGKVPVHSDAPASFPLGATVVTFTAKDAAGNVATKKCSVVVSAKPSSGGGGGGGGGAPAAPATPPTAGSPGGIDLTPPDDVAKLVAKAGDRSVRVSWTAPKAPDFDHVVVTRSRIDDATKTVGVYRGAATSFLDKKVQNGVEYRYLVVSVDRAGNQSTGRAVSASPQTIRLVRPADGQRVTAPPLLRWVPVSKATYYNVQLFRGSTKILTTWPTKGQLQLRASWTFGGKKYSLTPGTYRWFVWPGFGSYSAKKYGALLGQSSFVVAARRSS